MKSFVKSLAFVLVLVMCMGVFTACGDDTTPSGTTPSGTEPTGTTAPTLALSPVGFVKEISDTFIVLDLCAENVQGMSYQKLDPSKLEGTGKLDYVYLSTGALYGHFTDGELKSLKKTDLSVGDLIVVTANAKDVQQIVILNYKTQAPTDPTEATTPAV